MPNFLSNNLQQSLGFPSKDFLAYELSTTAELIIFDLGIISMIYFFLGTTIFINKCKFSHVAIDNAPTHSFSLQFKTLMMKLMILLYFSSAFMAFFVPSYWTYESSPFLGFFYFIPIIILLFNINWLKYQFDRKLPLLWYQNQLVWILLFVFYMFALVWCYLINNGNQQTRFSSPDFILMILKIFTSMTLFIYTCKIPQDRTDYLGESSGLRTKLISDRLKAQKVSMQTGALQKRKNMLHDSIRKRTTSKAIKTSFEEMHHECPLSVTVANKVQKREDPKTGSIEFLYKLQIKMDFFESKILKTMNDFKRLEKFLMEEEPFIATRSFIGESLNVVFSDPETEDMSNLSSIVLTLQNFCNNLLKVGKISNLFLIFLQIPEKHRFKILNWSKQIHRDQDHKSVLEFPESEDLHISRNKKNMISLVSEGGEIEEEEKKDFVEYTEQEGTITQDESLGLTRAGEKDYYPFFNVHILNYKKAPHKKYYEYVIKLQLSEKLDDVWEINKRYSDFVDLKHQLREKISVPTPKLPGKFILQSEEEQLEERRKGLESWLRIVLNEKIYFIPELFSFINLQSSYYEWLKDEETQNLSNFKAIIDSNQILISDNKPYTVYHIIIEQREETSHGRKKRCYALLRRYKEFDQLHNALQTRFKDSPIKLPELPPKYTTFSNKTTVDFRQQGLEKYLNDLFNFPNIGDSFAFRKFINFKRHLDSFIIFKETNDVLASSSSESEVKDISNIAIEKTLSTAKNKKENTGFKR